MSVGTGRMTEESLSRVTEGDVSKRDRRRAALELSCLILCVILIAWIVPVARYPKLAYAGFAISILTLLAVCHVRDRLSLKEAGIRVDNFGPVLARLSIPLLVFVSLIVGVGLLAGSLEIGPRFFSMLVFVPGWALLQQYMLLVFSNRRLRVILGRGPTSAVATAALFSFLHLPNPVLTLACAAGGYIWARQYERDPNLFATALTHAVASAFLANSLPGWLLKNMVVGYNFFFR